VPAEKRASPQTRFSIEDDLSLTPCPLFQGGQQPTARTAPRMGWVAMQHFHDIRGEDLAKTDDLPVAFRPQ